MGNIFQQLYNTVDSIVVGNYLGTSALAVGATTAICNTLVNFFNGISIGAGVVISTCFGSRNHEKLHEGGRDDDPVCSDRRMLCLSDLGLGCPADVKMDVNAG